MTDAYFHTDWECPEELYKEFMDLSEEYRARREAAGGNWEKQFWTYRNTEEWRKEYEAAFSYADKNGDGMLSNEDEFETWVLKDRENQLAKFGKSAIVTDDNAPQKWYKLLNKLTPHVDGIAYTDITQKLRKVYFKSQSTKSECDHTIITK
eukprot:CAMPEP_0201738954 /NCGR_PEP_ID=MMETSP0593-20130828/45519_1 /ASSEMBLY_ACC=CAM_ASM_000672 /TAXON_ID=267983 /ORGANISM="Skeletonema japonicum, Strain CCMP2506" /LENGTH=150 /DNA_ID=CAMNT_0048233185 /DNA_START=24 /DNA_END=476 /DNA_ORIENTATION=+